MPFVNSYLSVEKERPDDARERFRALASRVVPEPLSSHIVESRTRTGKTRYLIIDRNIAPREGSLVVYATDNGFRVRRFEPGQTPPERVWGVVAWFLEQG